MRMCQSISSSHFNNFHIVQVLLRLTIIIIIAQFVVVSYTVPCF